MWTTILLIILAAIIIFTPIILYNRLVRLKNQVENAWRQIDVQLKRRTDLIPNLIETVKGYVKHERETLDSVTQARAAVMDARKGSSDPKKAAQADNMLSSTLKSLFAVAESYPDLKANQNFLQLQEELSGTENKIAAARQYYNDMVMAFNTRIESFPDMIFAGIFNFTKKDLFEADEEDKKNIKVKF